MSVEQFSQMTCRVLLCDGPVSGVSPVSGDALEPPGLLSPCSTVKSLTKELQHSLDLASATSGDKVVTAQVSEAAGLTSHRNTVFSSAELVVYLLLFFFQENEDEQASSQSEGQTPGPQRPRSNSGRELTDEVSHLRPLHNQTPACASERSASRQKTCLFVIFNQEILASVMIKNLDTGEEIPLIQAEEKLPTGINPLTLHIMRRTKEYIT